MSLRGSSIFEGDYVAICATIEPKPGSIVLAVVDGNRLTLKRYMPPYLIGDDGERQEIITADEEIRICGVVVSHHRVYWK
jgi:SOS-response transcriptional repressor LexA